MTDPNRSLPEKEASSMTTLTAAEANLDTVHALLDDRARVERDDATTLLVDDDAPGDALSEWLEAAAQADRDCAAALEEFLAGATSLERVTLARELIDRAVRAERRRTALLCPSDGHADLLRRYQRLVDQRIALARDRQDRDTLAQRIRERMASEPDIVPMSDGQTRDLAAVLVDA